MFIRVYGEKLIRPLMRFRISFIIPALLFYAGQGCADGWQQDATVSVSAAYDTNPSLSPSYPGGAWIGTLTPSYTLYGNVGANQYKTGLAYRIERSSNQAVSSNREDPTIFLDWKRQIDLNEFGLSAQYHESSTRISEINNIGPGFVDSNAYYRTFTGTWKRELSERSTFFADGSYENVTYGGGLYTNYVARSGDMSLTYALNAYSSPFVKVSYIDYSPDNTTQLYKMNTAMLGWNWVASENLQGDLQAGGSNGDNVPSDAQYEASLHYKGQLSGFDFTASRLTSLNGLSGFVLADQVIAGWNYALNEVDKAGIDLTWRKNYYPNPVTNSSAGAWLEHDFNSGWKGRTYYVHRISEQTAGGGFAYSNEMGITLVYTQIDF
jgi:hypothetical protein